jgi:uncharacterized DUF497 family protein
MRVIWDKAKARKLLSERNISLEEIADLLMNQQFYEILEHPQRADQMVFVLAYKNYTHAGPLSLTHKEQLF